MLDEDDKPKKVRRSPDKPTLLLQEIVHKSHTLASDKPTLLLQKVQNHFPANNVLLPLADEDEQSNPLFPKIARKFSL